MRKRNKSAIGGLVLLTAFSLISCSQKEVKPQLVIRPVRYTPVYATGGTRVRQFAGVTQAGTESKLSFKVNGTVQQVAVKVGDHVRAGQLIAKIDARDYELQVQKAEASLTQAEAQARNAKASYERVRALYENNNTSLNNLDQARAAHESAEANVEAAQKQLELFRSQVKYCVLQAPIAGAVAAVQVEVNENVTAGRTVALLVSGSQLEVRVSMPEVLIAQVREGEKVTITFDAIPDQSYSARISEVGVASTDMVTTFPVTVVLDRANSEIRSGMAAEVTFTFESPDKRERFLVPSVAVGEDRQGRFVFLVEPTKGGFGVVHRREVTVGELTAEGLEIFKGLAEGDLLVTAGVSKLSEGQKVRLTGSMEKTR